MNSDKYANNMKLISRFSVISTALFVVSFAAVWGATQVTAMPFIVWLSIVSVFSLIGGTILAVITLVGYAETHS